MTSVARVREVSGFDNTTNITDAMILGKIIIAQSKVISAVGRRYALPLKYRRMNTLVFSGTGSGSGTLAITINGVVYNVAVTLGLTAASAAELFRVAAQNSIHFVNVASAVTTTIVSQSTSDDLTTADAEVNITSAPTAAGISVAIGIRSDRYPPILEQLVADIASALLLMDNYGAEAQDTPKDGDKKMSIAETLLKQIQGTDKDGLTIDVVDEFTNAELLVAEPDAPLFAPNDTTNVDEENPTDSLLGINDIW